MSVAGTAIRSQALLLAMARRQDPRADGCRRFGFPPGYQFLVRRPFDADVEVGPDTVLQPGTHLEGRTRVGAGCVVGPNTVIRDCVIGDGRLSFLVAQVLALNGAQVTVLGRHPEKLELFRDFAKTATELHRRFETVVDASGSPSGFDSAMSLVRSKGTIVMKSTYAGNKELNMSAVVVNEISVVGSRCGPFAPALRLLEKGALELPEISLFGLSQWREAFDSREFKVGFDLR